MSHANSFTIPSFDQRPLHVEHLANVRIRKKNNTPLIIFVHGLGGDLQAWKPTIQQLQQRFQFEALCYDLRGHGYSTRTFPPSEKDIYQVTAKDLDTLCNYFPNKQLILIGHSWGGIAVQEYLNRYRPAHVYGVVLVCSLPQMPFPFMHHLLPLTYQILCRVNPHNRVSHLLHRTVHDHYEYQNHFDYSLTRIYSDIRAMGLLIYGWHWIAAFGWKNRVWKNFDKKENLYFWGKNDWIVWSHAQIQYCKKFTKANSQRLSSNHNPLINNTQELAEVLGQYLSSAVDNSSHTTTELPN